jgi:hypothetical protein
LSPRSLTASGKSSPLSGEQGHVLNLHQYGEGGAREEADIQSTRLLPGGGIGQFPTYPRVTGQGRDEAGGNALGEDGVGAPGMDADPPLAHIDPLQGPGQTPPRIIAVTELHRGTRRPTTGHATRVGDMGGDQGAVRQRHVGKEPLVTAQDAPINQGWQSAWGRDRGEAAVAPAQRVEKPLRG